MRARFCLPFLTALSVLLYLAASLYATDIVAGPMIGHVSDTSARIWMQLSTSETVTLETSAVVGNRPISSQSIGVEGPAPFIMDVPLSDLSPNRNFQVEILFDNKHVEIPGIPLAIRTTPSPGEPVDFTMAFGSNIQLADGNLPQEKLPIFRSIHALKPRAFLFLGGMGVLPEKEDDFPPKKTQAYRFFCSFHKKLRLLPDLQPLFHETPSYAIWGARDFGTPDADRNFVYAQEALVAFERYWPNPDYGTPDNPGVYHTFTIGDVDVFMLDERYYRDAAKSTMLGESQLGWLCKGLKESKATFKIVGSASGILGDGASSWGQFKAERDDFLAWIFKNHVSGVVFLSGGKHLGELTARKPSDKAPTQYPLYELTSSPLAADIAPEDQRKNPLRSGNPVTECNFGALTFGGPRDKRHVTLRIYDAAGAEKLKTIVLSEQLHGE